VTLKVGARRTRVAATGTLMKPGKACCGSRRPTAYALQGLDPVVGSRGQDLRAQTSVGCARRRTRRGSASSADESARSRLRARARHVIRGARGIHRWFTADGAWTASTRVQFHSRTKLPWEPERIAKEKRLSVGRATNSTTAGQSADIGFSFSPRDIRAEVASYIRCGNPGLKSARLLARARVSCA
jgi:hypothetical protein